MQSLGEVGPQSIQVITSRLFFEGSLFLGKLERKTAGSPEFGSARQGLVQLEPTTAVDGIRGLLHSSHVVWGGGAGVLHHS